MNLPCGRCQYCEEGLDYLCKGVGKKGNQFGGPIQGLFFAMIVLSILLVGIGGFHTGILDNYNTTTENVSSLGKLNSTLESIANFSTDVQSFQSDSETTGQFAALEIFATGIWETLRAMFSISDVYISLFSDLFGGGSNQSDGILNLGSYGTFINFAAGILVLGIVLFAIIHTITKVKP